MIWTSERIETLTSLWKDGWPTRDIANEFGVTRNAVIGKLHRLKLLGIKPGGYGAPKKFRTLPKIEVVVSDPVGEQNVSLLKLTNATCRWPLGSYPFYFCGATEADLENNIPYCNKHTQEAKRCP